jgi:hypothetical protein
MVEVVPARPEDMDSIITWLCDPAIYQDAFWLAARPDPAWIKRSMLMVENNLGIELQRVRFWSVLEEDALLGFAIDFGWDSPDDTAREIDFALPRSDRRRPRLPVYTLAAIIHNLFARGATEAWGRVRVTASGRGFTRMFERIGCSLQTVRHDEMPTTGEQRARAYFRTTPAAFYASPLGERFTAPG